LISGRHALNGLREKSFSSISVREFCLTMVRNHGTLRPTIAGTSGGNASFRLVVVDAGAAAVADTASDHRCTNP
jgi:predicted ribosome-associated RNA-binding protein Tma20